MFHYIALIFTSVIPSEVEYPFLFAMCVSSVNYLIVPGFLFRKIVLTDLWAVFMNGS